MSDKERVIVERAKRQLKNQFTRDEMKRYAFWAVQWANRKENVGRVLHKLEVDEYLDSEIDS